MIGMSFLVTGCATLSSKPSSRPEQAPETPPAMSSRPEAPREPGPRLVASLKLTEQARNLIESNQPDPAIRIIEKAIAIDPANGQNYYYLAEAWWMKGDKKQALSFNRLAGIRLESDSDWTRKVMRQRDRIEKPP